MAWITVVTKQTATPLLTHPGFGIARNWRSGVRKVGLSVMNTT